jgi:putative two-component system response regulator
MEIDLRIFGVTILIADDHAINVRLLERILAGAGFHCVYTETDARQVARRVQHLAPELLVLDLGMPPLGGFGVLEQLHAAMPDPYPSILILTADGTSATRQRALDAGVDGYMTKPFARDEFLANVVRLLSRHKPRARQAS